jgi:hypothetical protein
VIKFAYRETAVSDLFKFEELYALAEKYIGHGADYYVAGSAPRPDAVFFSVPRTPYLHAHEVMQHLETGFYVLLKRPENYDLRFRELIDQLFAQVADSLGEFGDDQIVRRDAGIFIFSGATRRRFTLTRRLGFFFPNRRRKDFTKRPGRRGIGAFLRKRPCVDRAD